MENKVYNVLALAGGKVNVTFTSGDVYEYDLNNICAVIPDYKVAANPKNEKLTIAKDGDGFIVNDEISIDIEEILDSGMLVDHKIPDPSIAFGQMLRAKRKEKGINQGDVEAITGIYQTDISKYEHGIGNITIGTMKKLCDALDMNLEFTYSDKESSSFSNEKVADILSPYVPSSSRQGDYSIADVRSILKNSKLPNAVVPVLIDGALYNEGAKSEFEDSIASHFQFELNKYINKNKGKCIVSKDLAIISPGSVRDYIHPALTVVCDPSKITSAGIVGAPDFVLDIVSSTSTPTTTYRNKLGKYLSIGVREYWILDIDRKTLTVFGAKNYYCPESFSFDDIVNIEIFDEQLKIDLKQLQNIINN